VSDVASAWRDWLEAADERALPTLFALVSVRPESFRSWLRARDLPFVEPGSAPRGLREVDRTADHVVEQAGATGTGIAALGGLGGGLAAPSEAVAWAVATVRLAQRLAVVYGFDPSTPRGRAAVARALAAGFGAALPDDGPSGLRVTEVLRGVATRQPLPGPTQVGTLLARAVMRRSVRLATGRLGRLVPVVSSGVGAVENRRATLEIGARMKDVLRRLAEAGGASGVVVEALEVRRGGGSST
jgi:hypothetical protein